MHRTAIIFTLISIMILSFRSDKPAYKLYDSEGKIVKYEKMLNRLSSADVVFSGNCTIIPLPTGLNMRSLQVSMKLLEIDLCWAPRCSRPTTSY